MCSAPGTCPVAACARTHPGAPALVGPDRQVDYQALDAAVAARQATLAAHGIAGGDRVLLPVSASESCCVALWALLRMGAAVCPVNPASPQRLLDDISALVEARWVLDARDMAAARRIRTDAAPCPQEIATIVMTSGSSGAAKAAAHTLDNHLAAARAANANMSLSSGDRWLLSLPLFHVAGLAVLFRCALAGAAVALPPAESSLEAALFAVRPTHASLVPTQLYRLLESPRAVDALRAMKGILLGGAPAGASLIDRACDAGIPLVRSYGMTETAAQVCATPPGASGEDLQSSGRPLTPGTVRIGADAVVEVRSPSLFLGYYTGQGACQRPETADGWFRTGDVGFFDDCGLLHITGRADAMFISGGENIQPEEIEAALCTLSGVRRAVVVPVPHREYGEVPAAFVDMAPPAVLDKAALRDGLAQRLPRYKIPRCFLLWPETVPEGVKPNRELFAREARRCCTAKDYS